MIELNLLPKELRKRKKKKERSSGGPAIELPKLPLIPIVVGLLGVLIVAHLLFSLLVMNKSGLAKTLKGKWQEMQPQKEKTDAIARETNELDKKITAVRRIAKPDLSWTRVLSGLNQAIIPNVWLSEFALEFNGRAYSIKRGDEPPTSLVLKGYAVGKSGVATTTVAKFITSLKKNKDFSAYFDEVELENMRGQVIDGQEVMMFRLSCKFRGPTKAVVTGKKKK
ncbi:MAG: hypothetical protein P9L88_03575 [Candidatus Tantalella remota]|nr:hypothetical protein [Candidatus Tantalella remota]